MATTQLHEPVVARSGSSVHSREEDDFTQQTEENPLEVASSHQPSRQPSRQPSPQPTPQPTPTPTPTVASPIPPTPTGGSTTSSILPTPSVLVRQSPLAVQVERNEPDEPPPPYEELASQLSGTAGDAPQIAPIEYSVDNSPQLLNRPDPEFPAVPARNPDRPISQVGVSPLQSPNIPTSPVDSAALPSPLQPRAPHSHQISPEGSVQSPPPPPSTTTTFSSAKAREAGFEIETHPEQHPVHRNSTSSVAASSIAPSVTILSASDALKHVREPGKVMAYLIPFPKPRLKGIKPEDIPERFLIYTPPLPPSMKPVSNEGANTQTPKGKAPKVGWKTRTASFFNKGLNMTRSTNVEFLDRVSRGSVTAAEKDLPPESANLVAETPTPPAADPDALPPYSRHAPSIAPSIAPSTVTSIAPSDSASQVRSNNTLYRDASLAPASAAPSVVPPHSPSAPPPAGGSFFSAFVMTPSAAASSVPSRPARSDTMTSVDSDPKESKPKQQELEELTLIYPPSLNLTSDKIRTEFVDTLMRTRESSRRKALVASALLPFAATIDSCLVITFGGLTQMSGAWAYTNTQGALASSKISKGLARGEAEAHSHEHPETETHGCTCGHHEHDFGAPETVPKSPKNKKPSINLQLQQSARIEVLRRYLDLACFKKEFNLFPQIIETAGDVTEPMVLEAIGWKPSNAGEGVHPRGELPGDEELWQVEEAEVDVKRYMKKGAVEWVDWCKKFQKDFLKDPEAAVKK